MKPCDAPRVDIELSFDEFVRAFGGQVVRDLLPGNPPFPNAHYLFRIDNVVTELKCLEKDAFRSADIETKMSDLYER